jgi:phytanoyl-CoA hydroxylase
MATQTLRRLSPEQVESFWTEGYLILDPFVSPDEIATLRDGLQVLEDWIQVNEHPDFAREAASQNLDRMVIRKITNVHRHGGAPWWALMQRPETLDVFEDLLGPEIRFHHCKAMMKPPFEGSTKVWHQDLPEGFVSPAEAERLRPLGTGLAPEQVPVVAIQYYLDDSTAENGCIEVVPGSHRRGLFEDPLDVALIDQTEVRKAEISTGGALLFHCLTYHYSAPNTSALPRRAPVYEYFAPPTGVELQSAQQDFGMRMRPAESA